MQQTTNELLQNTRNIYLYHQHLSKLLMAPEIMADRKLYTNIFNEKKSLEQFAIYYKELYDSQKEWEKHKYEKENSHSHELQLLFSQEIANLESTIKTLAKQLQEAFLGQETSTTTSIILSIESDSSKASAFFARKLFYMYQLYAETENFLFETIEYKQSATNLQHAVFRISGKNAYNLLKNETGFHQAINILSSKSPCFVGISKLPDLPPTTTILNRKDLKIDTFHASGAGGQHVNKVETAVRITHIPSNLTTTCQDERSQLKNKEKALQALQTKVITYYKNKRLQHINTIKKETLKSKQENTVRIYDFLQQYIIDKRVERSFALNKTLDGDLSFLLSNIIIQIKKQDIQRSPYNIKV